MSFWWTNLMVTLFFLFQHIDFSLFAHVLRDLSVFLRDSSFFVLYKVLTLMYNIWIDLSNRNTFVLTFFFLFNFKL